MGGGGGRKNLKRGTKEHYLSLEDGQCIAQVVSLRGSNIIEVLDSRGENSLALFPAKFQKSMWMKLGSFVVVDQSGKQKALESGSKVASIVSQVLFYQQVRTLQKSPDWPEIFKSTTSDDTNASLQKSTKEEQVDDELDSSDEDGLPPLEANTNRVKPPPYESDSESNSGSDTDS